MNNNLSHWQDRYDILSADGKTDWRKGCEKAISEKRGCTVKMHKWVKIDGQRVHDDDIYAFSDGIYVFKKGAFLHDPRKCDLLIARAYTQVKMRTKGMKFWLDVPAIILQHCECDYSAEPYKKDEDIVEPPLKKQC